MRGMLAVFLTSVLIMMGSAWAQHSPATPGANEAGVAPLGGTAEAQGRSRTPEEIEMQKRLAKQRNQERFAKIKKDADQLLELATQLKKSVDQATDQTLSLDVIRKAEQIEKLAKQVRQKMAAE